MTRQLGAVAFAFSLTLQAVMIALELAGVVALPWLALFVPTGLMLLWLASIGTTLLLLTAQDNRRRAARHGGR